MASSADQGNHSHPMNNGYTAVLAVPTSTNRGLYTAAKGESRETFIAALQSLLDVTAAALEKYQGNIFKAPSSPSEMAGGFIDQSLVKQGKEKSWGSFLG